MSDAVVEETRTEIRAEEVTETRYRCHVCEMVYDETEVLTIGVDRKPPEGETLFSDGAEPRAERVLCHHCADGLFEYDADEAGSFAEPNTPVGTDWVTRLAAYTVAGVIVTVPTALAAMLISFEAGHLVTAPVLAVAAMVVGFALGVKI